MDTKNKIILEAANSLLARKPIRGLKREGARTEALGRAYDASLALLEALDAEDITLAEVNQLIEEKKNTVSDLKSLGIDWPL